MSALLQGGLLLVGSFFVLASALGMLRFPDFYSRLHAATLLVTLGSLAICAAAALTFSSSVAVLRLVLVVGFFFLTAPLSAYMIARSGYLRGLTPYREPSSVDEWDALGAQREEGEEP